MCSSKPANPFDRKPAQPRPDDTVPLAVADPYYAQRLDAQHGKEDKPE